MATYSDPAPAAEAGAGAGAGARAGSRRAKGSPPRSKPASTAGGVCAKRARVSVRRDTREAAAGGQGVVGPLDYRPRHFRLRSRGARRDGVAGGRRRRWRR